MFAYEVPLFMALLAPALIAQLVVTGMQSFIPKPLYHLLNIPAFVALISGQEAGAGSSTICRKQGRNRHGPGRYSGKLWPSLKCRRV